MAPTTKPLLEDIVSYGREAIEAVGDRSADQVLAERFREHAVLRTVQIVGEAAAQASKGSPEILASIPDLRRAVNLRNILVHGYTEIRMDEVIRIVRHELPDLISDVERLLGETE